MKRHAITITFNSLHHLRHKEYVIRLAKMFDTWVFVEGQSGSKGSTSWCKEQPEGYGSNGHSKDGTLEYLQSLALPSIKVITRELWRSKDEMVNAGLDVINDKGWLWQIDADEQWKPNDFVRAEGEMEKYQADIGSFDCNYYFGPDLKLYQENNPAEWTRLWRWDGNARFISHEPPIMQGLIQEMKMPYIKFDHYSYYYEQDVKYKSLWYRGHERVYQNWLKLQRETEFPQPISYLGYADCFGKTGEIRRTRVE